MTSIRVVFGLAANKDLEIEQLDVKAAFLHGYLDEEIYMEHQEGFIVTGREDFVCKMNKSIYGFKQVSRQWYKKFDFFMTDREYAMTDSDHCVYVKFDDDDFIILLLYVDDMLIVGHAHFSQKSLTIYKT